MTDAQILKMLINAKKIERTHEIFLTVWIFLGFPQIKKKKFEICEQFPQNFRSFWKLISKGLSNLDEEGVDLVDGQHQRRLLPSLLESALRVVVRPRLDGAGEGRADAVFDVGPRVGLRRAQHPEELQDEPFDVLQGILFGREGGVNLSLDLEKTTDC